MRGQKAVLILLLIFCFAVSQLGVVEAENVISFEEAIDAVNLGNYSGFPYDLAYDLLNGFPEQDTFHKEGITGFLVWLAPNGTYYQVEYQSGKILGKFAEGIPHVEYNPPDGYTFWWLTSNEIGIYWVNAFDGSILYSSIPRGSPVDYNLVLIQNLIRVAIPLILFFAIVAIVALIYRRSKRAEQ
jgi:hypothetical protein